MSDVVWVPKLISNSISSMNNIDFNTKLSSLYRPSYNSVLYFIFSKKQKVCLPHKPQQTGNTEQWKHKSVTNTVVSSTAAQTFCFHSSDASVCRIVRRQLKRKPSADSKDLKFCCCPAQYCSIPSRPRFERSIIWSQLASQIHF